MKWKILLIPFIFVFYFKSEATHIVGGEIELVHDSAYFYTVNLILYFDSVNGNPGAEDPFVRVGIFRKFDDALMDSLFLPKTNSTLVPYSFPDCSIPELQTKRLTYSAPIQLSPAEYNDFGGYYMSWDRCCRNDIISNLLAPGTQGQLFYLEFPPVELNGSKLENSSPVLFPPVSDYACRGDLFYFDFSGTDPDGDSLVYSLSNPLRGFSSVSTPSFFLPFPGPYPEVIWQSGFNVNNMIPGSPPLGISNDGFLTVRPNDIGLFVFAVKCEEYRNGVKIGEIRRDFQIIVQDCPSNEKPQISVQNPLDSSNYNKDDTIYISLAERCFNIFLQDPDPGTKFNVEINPLNFDSSTVSINPKNGVLPNGQDSLRAEICFNRCAYTDSIPYQFEIILSDDGCSLPKKDTFLVTAIVEAIPDQVPLIGTNFNEDTIKARVGDTIAFEVFAVDSDNDTIRLRYGNNGFQPSNYDMEFNSAIGQGQVNSSFFWVIDCEALILNGRELIFESSDFICSNFKTEVRFPLQIITDNVSPILSTSLDTNQVDFEFEDGLNFNVDVLDSNAFDYLSLGLEVFDSTGQLLQNLNYSLSPLDGTGFISSQFNWKPECELLDMGNFLLQFKAEDNGCSNKKDSILLKANIEYNNSAPVLGFLDEPENGKLSRDIEMFVDSVISIDFLGEDIDNDFLRIRVLEKDTLSDALLPFSFQGEEDFGYIQGELQMGPAPCFDSETFSTALFIILNEESCTDESDTIELNIEFKEYFSEVDMPNVFTPNGDGINDFFYPIQLPKKCQFSSIRVYNRWGIEVYRNDETDFRWDGGNLPSGDYFYQLIFEEARYKGIVKLLR